MAFATTQTINTALFRNIFFRNNDNSAISTNYILNTNGIGGVSWKKSIAANNLSTVYSSITNTFSTINYILSSIQSSYSIFSTQTLPTTVPTLSGTFQSTFTYFYNYNSTLALSFNALSNQQTALSNALTGALVVQTNQIYISSLQIAQSTYNAYMNPSTFLQQISSLNATGEAAMSSISTAIITSGNAQISSLLPFIHREFLSTLQESYKYTDSVYSTLYSVLITTDDLASYSTQYAQSQIGNFINLQTLYDQEYGIQTSTFSTIQNTYTSTLINETSSILGIVQSAYNIYDFSTNINSSIFNQVSSITYGVFKLENEKLSEYFSTITEQISSIYNIVKQNTELVSTLSSYTLGTISTLSTVNSEFFSEISGLASTFSTLTLSSILGNVYTVFNLFEIFCNDLVISTTTSISFIQSTNFYSTILENTSTTTNYFSTLFQDSFTQSTIQTISSLANQFLSSYISTQFYSNPFIRNSIQSTIVGKTNEYNSTTRSVYTSQLSTNINLNQSTILNNLSTPTSEVLSTFTNLGNQTISTFIGLGNSSILGQVNLFSTQLVQNQILQTSLFNQLTSTNSSFQSSFLFYSTLYNPLFSTVSASSQQQSTQSQTLFISSLISYNSQFSTMLPSTISNYAGNAIYNASTVFTTLNTSTIIAYSTTVTNLLNTVSTVLFSTLYTEQQFTLQGTNFFANLDFRNFTNFFIRVREPLISGTASSYTISYTSNAVSSLSLKSGIILVDVSTPTSLYTNNGSKLALNTYRWGLPTTIWMEFLPSISTGNYLAMYEYTIQDNIVYTNLMNVYPRLTHTALQLQTSTNTSVANSFWRGSRLTFSWSNYSYLPYGAIGLPAYASEIAFDILVNNVLFSNIGPFDFTVSTATIQLPYLTGGYTNPVQTTIRSYIVGGRQQDAQQINLFTILPQIANITLSPPSGNFLALAQVTAFSDGGTSLVNSGNISIVDGSGNTDAQFQIQAMNFNGTTSYLSIPNTSDLRFGTGDFTVEFYMYSRYTGVGTLPRVFAFGTDSSATFSFSLEHFSPEPSQINRPTITLGGTQYVFAAQGESLNTIWTHIAITRQSSSLRLFINGILIGVTTTSYNFNDSTNPLSIGCQLDFGISPSRLFNGYITNFRWITGTALYTANFTPPSRPLQAISNTRILLLASSSANVSTDSSGTGKSIFNANVTYPTFSRTNLFDGNFSTYTIGPSTIGVSSPFTQLQINTQLQTTLTSLSSLRIVNIDPTQRITGNSTTDANELTNSILTLNATSGPFNYISTIQLTSSAIQTFVF